MPSAICFQWPNPLHVNVVVWNTRANFMLGASETYHWDGWSILRIGYAKLAYVHAAIGVAGLLCLQFHEQRATRPLETCYKYRHFQTCYRQLPDQQCHWESRALLVVTVGLIDSYPAICWRNMLAALERFNLMAELSCSTAWKPPLQCAWWSQTGQPSQVQQVQSGRGGHALSWTGHGPSCAPTKGAAKKEVCTSGQGSLGSTPHDQLNDPTSSWLLRSARARHTGPPNPIVRTGCL